MVPEINQGLRSLLEAKGIYLKKEQASSAKTAVLFPGHGSQYKGMLQEIAKDFTVVSQTFAEANDVYRELEGKALTDYWMGEELNQVPTIMQPSIITANMAMYQLITSELDVKPDFMLGHSLGEISALLSAKVIHFRDALRIAYARGSVLKELCADKQGKMLAIDVSNKRTLIEKFISEHPHTELGIVNSPTQWVISGTNSEMTELAVLCQENSVKASILPVPFPFHSQLLERLSASFYDKIKEISFSEPEIPVFSTILTRFYQTSDFENGNMPKILASQLIQPFNFNEIVQHFYSQLNVKMFIECGCSNILTNLVKQILTGKEFTSVYVNNKKESQRLTILKAQAKLRLCQKGEVKKTMNSELFDHINKLTGYPVQVIEQQLQHYQGSNYGLELALAPDTQKQIVLTYNHKMNTDYATFNQLLAEALTHSAASDKRAVINQPNSMLEKQSLAVEPIPIKRDEITSVVKKIIQEKTGYPIELLEEHADLEADLGIDSVKQAEILAKVRDYYGYEADLNINIKDYQTIGLISNYVGTRIDQGSPADPAQMETTDEAGTQFSPKPASVTCDEITSVVKEIIQEKTGYPIELLEEHADLEADLGIDSVKQAEILAKVRDYYGYEADPNINIKDYQTIGLISNYAGTRINQGSPADPAQMETMDEAGMQFSPKPASVTCDEITSVVKKIIQEKTGYPIELLEEHADLEADLGIDSVKQAEILAKVRDYYGYEADPNINIKDYQTIGLISNYVGMRINQGSPADPAQMETMDEAGTQFSPKPASVTCDEITSVVKEIIQEKTGYPIELLEEHADLEADLGIDSVKQAEILAKIRKHYGYELDDDIDLKNYTTIARISVYVLEQLDKVTASPDQMSNVVTAPVFTTKRYTAHTILSNLESEGKTYLLSKKRILLVEDSLGGSLTEEVAKQLAETNQVEIIALSKIDFLDIAELKKSLSFAVDRLGQVDCVINLQGLTPHKKMSEYISTKEWEAEYLKIYNGLFYSTKVTYNFLENNPETAYFAAVNIGNYFGIERGKAVNPLGAITTGFVKALEKELRPQICKVVDITDPADYTNKELAELLLKEYSLYAEDIEVGYRSGVRKSVFVSPASLAKNKQEQLLLNKQDHILVTGGGRGITFECVKHLTNKTGVNVILTGRTPLPNGEETWLQLSDQEFEKYKQKYMLEMKQKDHTLSVLDILMKYNQLKAARELYNNMQEIKHLGTEIQYIQCDFASELDAQRLKDYLVANAITISGIINGAGLPSFGKIPTKNEVLTLKVLQVKANSMYLIQKYFLNKSLKFIANMGSISGRFGMDGQVDYSAAADFLVKLSTELTVENTVKSFVVGWPAWNSVGMAATEEVIKVQKFERGLSYISIQEGTQRFFDEIQHGKTNEVLFFDQLGERNMPLGQLNYLQTNLKAIDFPITDDGAVLDREQYPMLDKIDYYSDDEILAVKHLRPWEDLHLREHKVNGTSVLAGVLHVELACELFKLFMEMNHISNYQVSEIKDFSFNQFIKIFYEDALKIKVVGKIIEKNVDECLLKVSLYSDFITKEGVVLQKNRLHSTGYIVGRTKTPAMVKVNVPEWKDTSEMSGIALEKYYEKGEELIYFGEHFRNILTAQLDEQNDIVQGSIMVKDESDLFTFCDQTDTVINPILVDNIGRFMLLNEFAKSGDSIIPVFISKAVKHQPFVAGELVDVVAVKVCEEKNEVTYNAAVFRKSKELLFEIEQMKLRKIGQYKGNHDIKA